VARRSALGTIRPNGAVLAEAVPQVSRTRPLPLGRRLAGSIDNVGEVLAIAEGEDYR